ncbi:hypothetical protein R3X25_05945 [Lutibacter sp. TH_r2]|uniref:hypothetical protein n=1 Tax=Lutibacter sp. TH_r2 TaxID=3082083 RepID=UPI0029543ECE|nr:hypothetical protein [Lutibacter sp. TH_r2]MDV7186818.1 hypothetical protein [Lutibacter sp. TH_r2]
MKKGSYILFLLIGMLTLSSFLSINLKNETDGFKLITTTKKFVAGNKIELQFSTTSDVEPLLIIKSSYGSTILKAVKKQKLLTYTIPKVFSKKIGVVNWTLINNTKIALKNNFEIIPNISTKTVVESYLGPISIQAGNRDFSMLVVVPTDALDNPLPVNTSVKIHEQFLNNVVYSEEKIENFIVWHNIMAKEKSGEIFVSSSCNTSNSKEFSTVIYPSNATDFKINFERNHSYADGNQQTTFETSIIKDEFGNIISDGTLVEFNIKNLENSYLKTRASTIGGIAKAKILHPDYPTTWNVKAFISGLAQSNNLTVNYKSVISDFDIEFTEGNRKIVVGPLKSYMNQIIPDGAVVKLHIYSENEFIELKSDTSFKGFVTFYLDSEFYKKPTYNFTIEALGVSKKIEQKNYAKIVE